MQGAGYEDLGFARVDVDRAARTGDPEVGYGGGKTVEQGVALRVHGERVRTKLAQPAPPADHVSVEYEDVRAAADALGLPVKEVLRAATAAACESAPG